jgi:hypothetical protein
VCTDIPIILPPNGLAEDLIGSRQEPGEVEPAGAGAAGGPDIDPVLDPVR